jgi:hypothetical protein
VTTSGHLSRLVPPAVALAVAGCCLFEDYCHLVTLDCGQGREIRIYEDGFCDVGIFFYFEVRSGGRVVVPKQSTGLVAPCGDYGPESFRLVADEPPDLFPVLYDSEYRDDGEDVAAVYDFATGRIAVPRSGDDTARAAELLDRLGLSAPGR